MWAPAASATFAPTPAVAQRRGFSEAERHALEHGRLVVREEARRRGTLRLIGGTSFQIIDHPPEVVWRAVLDTERYPRFVPEAVEARIVEGRGDPERLVFLRHEQGPVGASYFVNVHLSTPRRTMQFRVDRTRPGDLSEGWGFLRVTRFGDRQSMVTFGIFADVGGGILAGFVRPRVHEWMMRVPELLKRYLEGSGRRRYLTQGG